VKNDRNLWKPALIQVQASLLILTAKMAGEFAELSCTRRLHSFQIIHSTKRNRVSKLLSSVLLTLFMFFSHQFTIELQWSPEAMPASPMVEEPKTKSFSAVEATYEVVIKAHGLT
jgi:hypothetical protein